MEDLVAKTSNGHKISSIGSALAFICFFLPWILVSCGGESIRLSGWQLAAGTKIYEQPTEGRPLIFLVLLVSILVLVIVFLAYKRGSLNLLFDGIGPIVLGSLALVVLIIEYANSSADLSSAGIDLSYQIGLWGVVLGNLAVLGGGVLNYRQLNTTQASTSPPLE